MDIDYANADVRRLCEEAKYAAKKIGPQNAKQLQTRLSQLRAAASFAEMVLGRPHPLRGEFSGCIAFTIAGGWRIVVRPINEPLPQLESGGLDPSRVTIVRIEYIGDYHD